MGRSGTGTSIIKWREMKTLQQIVIKIPAESIIGTFRLDIGYEEAVTGTKVPKPSIPRILLISLATASHFAW